MSGGYYNYGYINIEQYKGHMKDPEINALLEDFSELLQELEWCDSGDTSESEYRASVKKFKDKWLRGNSEREIKLIEESVDKLRNELLLMIGKEDSPCATCFLGVFNDDMSSKCLWENEPNDEKCRKARKEHEERLSGKSSK